MLRANDESNEYTAMYVLSTLRESSNLIRVKGNGVGNTKELMHVLSTVRESLNLHYGSVLDVSGPDVTVFIDLYRDLHRRVNTSY